jgi:hypothetical protein
MLIMAAMVFATCLVAAPSGAMAQSAADDDRGVTEDREPPRSADRQRPVVRRQAGDRNGEAESRANTDRRPGSDRGRGDLQRPAADRDDDDEAETKEDADRRPGSGPERHDLRPPATDREDDETEMKEDAERQPGSDSERRDGRRPAAGGAPAGAAPQRPSGRSRPAGVPPSPSHAETDEPDEAEEMEEAEGTEATQQGNDPVFKSIRGPSPAASDEARGRPAATAPEPTYSPDSAFDTIVEGLAPFTNVLRHCAEFDCTEQRGREEREREARRRQHQAEIEEWARRAAAIKLQWPWELPQPPRPDPKNRQEAVARARGHWGTDWWNVGIPRCLVRCAAVQSLCDLKIDPRVSDDERQAAYDACRDKLRMCVSDDDRRGCCFPRYNNARYPCLNGRCGSYSKPEICERIASDPNGLDFSATVFRQFVEKHRNLADLPYHPPNDEVIGWTENGY